MNQTNTITMIAELNKKLASNYDLSLSYIGNTNKLRCYHGSWRTEETQDLCFAMDLINRDISRGASLQDLSHLPFFK